MKFSKVLFDYEEIYGLILITGLDMDKRHYGQFYGITDAANRVPFWLKVNLLAFFGFL